jgi:hypothetical protein
MRTCRKCNIEKTLDEYGKNNLSALGKETICKKCKADYSKMYRLNNPEKTKENNSKFRELYLEETNGYAVYYLPEEHYVGFTNNMRSRMNDHRKRGRSILGFEVICKFENPIDAHLFETMLHQRGYHGFQHKY